MWSLPFVSVLYSSSFFGRGGVELVSLLASQWVLVLVLVSSLDDMGVVVLADLLLVFELSVAMEVLVVLSFGSMDNQALVGLVLELMSGLAFVLDVASVSQSACGLVLQKAHELAWDLVSLLSSQRVALLCCMGASVLLFVAPPDSKVVE